MRPDFPLTAMLGAVLATLSNPASAQAQTAPGQKPLHVEVRAMVWADASGAEAIPDQQERITDPFVRHDEAALATTYCLNGHDRKLQADFTRRRESPELDNDAFRLSVVLVF